MPAQRLSALDASFLSVETDTAHMHVGWAAVFEPPEDRAAPNFRELRDHIARRLMRAPRCRQRIQAVPLDLGPPAWVDDREFDISRHVVDAGPERLQAIIDDCLSEPLPHDRPLWQMKIAPRLADGRIGIVGKAHHCMVDGIAAVELASLLLDPTPDASDPEPDKWHPSAAPGSVRLFRDAALDFARAEISLATLPARMLRSPRRALNAFGSARRAVGALADAVRPAQPVADLNDPISAARHLGVTGRSIGDLVEIKRAFEVTLNDVVLAVSAGGVRRLLRRHGEDPICLKAMVPVNVRSDAESGDLGNRISFMFIDLPCDEPDPVRRLHDIHAATSERKEAGEAEGAEAVIRSISFAPSPVQRLVGRMLSSPRTFNLVVSNIPGPREPLFMRGCLLVDAYPVVPIAEGHSLSIGFTTVRDRACFGLYADPRSLPDVDTLAGEIDLSIDELLERAADPTPTPAYEVIAPG